MSSSTKNKVFLLLACMIVCVHMPAHGQDRERLIEKIPWKTEPIKIQKLKAKAGDIEIGRKFVDDENWLYDLKAIVKNTSNKVVTRIELQLSFPRPANSKESPTYMVSMIYGGDPSDKDFDAMMEVQPGQAAEVKLVNSNIPLIKKDLADLGYPQPVTHAELKIESVTFIDGSMWSNDLILYPDPGLKPTNPRLLSQTAADWLLPALTPHYSKTIAAAAAVADDTDEWY